MSELLLFIKHRLALKGGEMLSHPLISSACAKSYRWPETASCKHDPPIGGRPPPKGEMIAKIA